MATLVYFTTAITYWLYVCSNSSVSLYIAIAKLCITTFGCQHITPELNMLVYLTHFSCCMTFTHSTANGLRSLVLSMVPHCSRDNYPAVGPHPADQLSWEVSLVILFACGSLAICSSCPLNLHR